MRGASRVHATSFLGDLLEVRDGHARDEDPDRLVTAEHGHRDLDRVALQRLVEPRFLHLPRLARRQRRVELLLTLVYVADRLLGERDLLAVHPVEERLVERAAARLDFGLEKLPG